MVGEFSRVGKGLAAAAQVGLDQELGIVLHQRAIDLHIFEHALYVIACFGDRYPLDPIDRINPRIRGSPYCSTHSRARRGPAL